MGLFGKIKLALQFKAIKDAYEEEVRMGYDIKVGLAKAIRDFVVTSAAVGGAAVLSYFADAQHLSQLLGFLPDTLQHALTPLVSAGIVFALNWIRHKDLPSGN